jgi:MFS family permease
MDHTNLEDLESEAYQESFSDGLVDLFLGLGLASIGFTWLWFAEQAGLAGGIAAVIAWALVPIRRRVVEPRIGYVRWTAPRLKWERKQLRLLFWLVTIALLSGVAVAQSIVNDDTIATSDRTFVAGMPAILLAIGAFVLATTSGFKRLWIYGAVLLSAATVTILIEAGPGGSLLAAGAVIGVFGAGLLIGFLRGHPIRT